MKKEEMVWGMNEEKGYNRNPVMVFFNEILELFETILSVYLISGNHYVALSYRENTMKLDILQEEFSETVTTFFLAAANSEREMQEYITVEAERVSEYCLTVRRQYKLKNVKFHIESETNQDIQVLDKIDLDLDTVFLEETSKKRIKEEIRKLSSIYQNIDNKKIWTKKNIFEYLNTYYSLLGFLLVEKESLLAAGAVDAILIPLLNLGIRWEMNRESGYVQMNAPAVLSALNLIYDRLNEYARCVIFTEPKQDEKVKKAEMHIYRDIFLSKIHQIFRFYVVRESGGELYHAALPIYDVIRDNAVMKIPIRPIQSYDSFQGIRELRLGEKILYELEMFEQKVPADHDKVYHVILMGEVEEEPLKELIAYLKEKIFHKEIYRKLRNRMVDFTVYTKKKFNAAGSSENNYRYFFHKYENELQDANKLDGIIKEADLLFLMDNCDLYNLDVDEIKDEIVFMQSVSVQNYEKYYRSDKHEDLTLNCRFMDLYNAFVSYGWKGKLGRIKKTAKGPTIKYIREQISSSTESEKTCYIYISDISAFKELSCIQEQFVRIEKYNQKEIGLLRLTTYSKEKLPVKAVCAEESGRNILVFNMWQFVKHIVINEREEFENILLNQIDEENEYFLDDIYIGIDYSDWKDSLKVFYYWENEQFFQKDHIIAIIRIIVNMVSYRQKSDMYQRYLKKAFVSFLYGAAKSVEDLIFLHILKRKGELHGKYEVVGADEEIIKHYNLNCKYSYKKNYWTAIEKFDREAVSYIDRHMILGNVEETGTKKEFAANIAEACRNIEYEDSMLYREFRNT